MDVNNGSTEVIPGSQLIENIDLDLHNEDIL